MDEYRAFAEAPSLSLLRKWLIKNEWIKIPQLAGGYLENRAEDIPDGRDWILFFIPRVFLGEDGICGWMLQDETTPVQIVRGVLQSEHEQTLERFLRLLRQQEEDFRAQVCESVQDLLGDSDFKSAKNEYPGEWKLRFGQYAEARKDKLNQIFQDESFKAWCERELGWTTWGADTEETRIAVLILIALLNLKSEQQEWELHYFVESNGEMKIILERESEYNVELVSTDEKIWGLDSLLYSKVESEDYIFANKDETYSTDRTNEPDPYGRRR